MYELTNETIAGRKYYARLELLDDGTVLTNYGDDAVGITSISLSQTLCGSESVSIGCVNAACATIVLETGTALENQRFALYLGQEFDGAVEWVPMGIFTVTKAEFSEGRLTAEAWDDLYFAGGAYTPSDSVTGECSVATALDDVCNQLGIQFLQASVPEDVTLAGMPTGLTCSAAIGYLAALCGASACMNRTGDLEFRQLEKSGQTLGTDDCYSGGMVFKTSDFTVASLTNTLEVETAADDGATTTETTEVERTTGAAGGCISLTNPLMTEDNIDTAWDVVKGFTYRPATLTAVGQLAVDVGDVLTVTDADGAVYSVPVMTHTLEYDGGLKSTITAAGESESQQSAAVSGPVAQQIKELTTKVTDTKVLASGKNAVYYAAAAPSADDYTLSVNDLWFDTSGGDYAPHYWNGSEWVDAPFGSDALGEGSVIASKIAAGEVTAEKINVADLFAQNITATGSITGLALYGGSININDKFTVDSEGRLASTSGVIGGFTIGATMLSMTNGTSDDEEGDDEGSAVVSAQGVEQAGTYNFLNTDCADDDSVFLAVSIPMTASGYYPSKAKAYIMHDGRAKFDSLVVGGTLDVTGAVTLGGKLTVSGSAALESILTVAGDIYNTGGDFKATNGHGFYSRNTSGSLVNIGYMDTSNNVKLGSRSYPIYLYGSSIYANSFPIPEIQRGSVSVTVAKETNTEFSVTFDQAFSGTPTITLTPAHTYAEASGVGFKILSSSSTGFTGCLYDNAARTIRVNWIAMY